MHRRARATAAIVCALGALALLPSAAGAVTVGIGDQNAGMFSHPAFRALHIHEARLTVSWDVAVNPARRGALRATKAWLSAAAAAGVTPLVSFSGIGNYIPTGAQYTNAIRAFLNRFPRVKRYTAWNEPDWIYRSISRRPSLAAAFFTSLYVQCRGCTVLAGDLYLAAPQLGSWLRAYRRGLHHRPAGWALHNYHDVRTHTDAQLRTMLQLTSGPIWLDEISGVERRGHWPFPNQSAAAAGRDESFLFSLAGRYKRISRIYHYQWRGVPWAGWDSGLVTVRGQKRPAYYIVRAAAR